MINSRGYLLAATVVVAIITGCGGGSMKHIGIKDGALHPCPSSPNCVSSLATDKEHGMPPIIWSGDTSKAIQVVVEIMKKQPRCEVITISDTYIHATFKSKVFRFTDDVEFHFPSGKAVIHFRSASRKGYSDMGVNRKRMIGLIKEIEAALKELQ